MTNSHIAHQRLHSQLITRPTLEQPGDVVGWLGAVQAQDYFGALWAVGLRTLNATEADVEQAIADRQIIRTWPMRGTLHFVAPADIRWMLKLLTPRIVSGNAQRLWRQANLDEVTFARSADLLMNALQGGKQLTRGALYTILELAGISAAEQRGLFILHRLAQEGLICFAARQGKQPTFALLDEWVPTTVSKNLERDESLAELASRYFTSHGPATLQDFVWWSGLPAADARAGLEMVKSQLTQDVIGGQAYWLSSSVPAAQDTSPNAYLLPTYDEYTVAYKDRSAIVEPAHAKRMAEELRSGILDPTIAVNGQIVGNWKRTLKRDSAVVTPQLYVTLSPPENDALAAMVSRYSKFLNLPVILS